MCYQVRTDFSDVDVRNIKEFAVTKVNTSFNLNLDVFPKQKIPVIIPGSRILDLYTWGLIPSFIKDLKTLPSLANARSETLIEKPSFRQSFMKKRCLILASGFYEWDKLKIQHFFQIKDTKIFAFAGLYDEWKSNDGKIIKSCTIITCNPNNTVKKIHKRMPVILYPKDYELWLTGTSLATLKKLLVPYNENMIEKELEKRQKIGKPTNNSIEKQKTL